MLRWAAIKSQQPGAAAAGRHWAAPDRAVADGAIAPLQEEAGLHAIVCIKAVPDTTEVRIDPETNTLMREQMDLIINPFDMYAIEEALRLKEKHGGRITVITMGPPKVEEQLREALAMGCDEAVLLSSREFAGSDTWATAYALAAAIRALGDYDVILCGKQAIDGDTGQVGPGIANQLAVSQLTYVFRVVAFDPEGGAIRVERLLEEGRELVETRLPALLTVVKDINQPRSPTPRGVRKARRQDIRIWSAADLGDVDPDALGLDGSPTHVICIASPERRGGSAEMLDGAHEDEVADLLSDRILAEKVI
jgi:electron transfer flavoprotein beta subunit